MRLSITTFASGTLCILALLSCGWEASTQRGRIADLERHLQRERQNLCRERETLDKLLEEKAALKREVAVLKRHAKPYLCVTVEKAEDGYRIKGTTNLPDGSRLTLMLDDWLQPSAIVDEVTVLKGTFRGPVYTVEGKFDASASRAGHGLESNKQGFEFYDSRLSLR